MCACLGKQLYLRACTFVFMHVCCYMLFFFFSLNVSFWWTQENKYPPCICEGISLQFVWWGFTLIREALLWSSCLHRGHLLCPDLQKLCAPNPTCLSSHLSKLVGPSMPCRLSWSKLFFQPHSLSDFLSIFNQLFCQTLLTLCTFCTFICSRSFFFSPPRLLVLSLTALTLCFCLAQQTYGII